MHIDIGLGLRIKTLNDKLMFVEVSVMGKYLMVVAVNIIDKGYWIYEYYVDVPLMSIVVVMINAISENSWLELTRFQLILLWTWQTCY